MAARAWLALLGALVVAAGVATALGELMSFLAER